MDLQGKKFTLSEFKGKAIFLNFWASWCGPCIQEMESIMALEDQFKDSLIFLAASAEDQTQIEKFIAKHNINLNFVRLTGSYLDAFIISLPTTLLIDRHGKLLEEVEGYRDWTDEANVRKIKRLIKY
ncbi:MAG: TlpA family protein disulfide reductase [Saprospiraceae bacterium]|nr:TlpA family protein disulfide reductase [Saprospiraceae bacterium]